MSLVNDMLRDLDRRKRADHRQESVQAVFHRSPEEPGKDRLYIAVIVALCLAIGLTAGILYLRRSPDLPPAIVPEANRAAANEADAPAVSVDPAGAAEVLQAGESAGSMPAELAEEDATSLTAPVPEETVPAGAPVLPQPAAVVSVPAPAPAAAQPPAAPPVESARIPAPVQAPLAEEREREEVLTARAPTFTERDRNASQEGIGRAQRGQLLEAYDLLLDFVAANPEAHQSRETLVTLLLAQQEFTQAAAQLREGLAIAPNHSGYKKLQARLYMRGGKLEQAIALLTNLPPAIEEDVEYHDLLAALLQQAGKHDKAVAAYQALLRSDAGQARWWTAMAISHEALGNTHEAIASYEAAAQIPDIDPRLEQYGQDRINSLRLQP